MKTGGQSVAIGAALMVALKLIERLIGVVSTIILARLLIPEDFGLVAMAMAVLAILELAGQFGFDHAIIRQNNPPRTHLDTAWTLTVCHGLLSGAALVTLAVPVSQFFGDPRLENIIYLLAVIAVVQGFENIGIILFRKEMEFKKDFNFFLAKKLITFFFTVVLAFTFKSYWALIGGTLISRTTGVLLSYFLHPYRPRISFRGTRELFGFSKWILLTGILGYLSNRGPDFLLGRFSNAASVGVFRIASELATLPTTELMFPIARAAYPGYAKVSQDPEALRETFLAVQASIITLTLPAGIGLIMVADPFVKAILGFKWLETIPLIQILGLYGALRVFQTTNHAIFNILGKPYWNTVLMAVELVTVLPALGWMIYQGYPISTAAWAYLFGSAIAVPLAVTLISRFLKITFHERFKITWRPILATLVMSLALSAAFDYIGTPVNTEEAIFALLLLVPLGAITYTLAILSFWRMAKMPIGAESKFIKLIQQRFIKT